MQENWHQIVERFNPLENFVLATIVQTSGSTYRKMGTMMLIAESGDYIGLLSGGCLEADISLHANRVLQTQQSQLLQYDLKADADLLWGLGLGCEGTIDIYLQPLLVNEQHLGFMQLISAIQHKKTGYYCQRVNEQLPPYAWFVEADNVETNQLKSSIQENSIDIAQGELLVTPITPIVSLLLCGAGPDAIPVIQMAEQLGWQVTLQDHRANNLAQVEFDSCIEKRKLRAENTTKADFLGFDGVIIMTHNLINDGFLLKGALSAKVDYIGLLGPEGRRDKLLNELSLTYADVKGQVFGPIGLDLGGRSPHAIALSICAEIQQHITLKQQQNGVKSWRQ